MFGFGFLSYLLAAASLAAAHQHSIHGVVPNLKQAPLHDSIHPVNGISSETRAHWMRRANDALLEVTGSPCPFAAFGTAIVNHTLPGLGDEVCIGANGNARYGNPTLHGEIAGINNCTAVLTDPKGRYRLSPAEALAAFSKLSLYTTAEPCPMCASAIRWAGMRELIYGTSHLTLIDLGWGQMDISSLEVFERSKKLRSDTGLASETSLLANVLSDEMDELFKWQFDKKAACPKGCGRMDGVCHYIDQGQHIEL